MLYDVAILINLKRREDRTERVLKHLEKRGVKNLLVFPAFDANIISNMLISPPRRPYFSWTSMSKGVIGCALSHIAAIKMAQSLGHKSVLILEDDVVLSKDFNERLEVVEKEMPEDCQHLFLGGAIRKQEHMKKVSEHIYTSCYTDCTHCYIVRNDGMDLVSNEMLKFNTTLDDAVNDLIITNRIKSYTFLPLASYQIAGFSDIDNKFIARNDTMNGFAESL